jgi:hypothetical protein
MKLNYHHHCRRRDHRLDKPCVSSTLLLLWKLWGSSRFYRSNGKIWKSNEKSSAALYAQAWNILFVWHTKCKPYPARIIIQNLNIKIFCHTGFHRDVADSWLVISYRQVSHDDRVVSAPSNLPVATPMSHKGKNSDDVKWLRTRPGRRATHFTMKCV